MPEYYFRPEGVFHAQGPVKAESEKEARREIRALLNKKTLHGVEVWETSPSEREALHANYKQHQAGIPAWARGPL